MPTIKLGISFDGTAGTHDVFVFGCFVTILISFGLLKEVSLFCYCSALGHIYVRTKMIRYARLVCNCIDIDFDSTTWG